MSFIDDALAPIPIPRMARIRQVFERPVIEDVAQALRERLVERRVLDGITPGMPVAITAGSRGIANMPFLLRVLAAELRRHGAKPFLVPVMGSHGGATADGQKNMLAGMGITEEAVGLRSCPGWTPSGSAPRRSATSTDSGRWRRTSSPSRPNASGAAGFSSR